MTEKNKFAVVVLPEMIACACADFSRVFLTIVAVQNVGNVEPLGARPFFGFVFPVLFQIVCDLLYT